MGMQDTGPHLLLGKHVQVTLDENVIVTGQFLGFGDGGDFEILEDDGFVHHCWPLLSITQIPTPQEAEG